MLTIAKYHAVNDLAYYSRDELKAETAEQIASGFGLTLDEIGITPYDTEAGIDWGMRIERSEGGKAVANSTLAWAIADKLSPGWSEGVGSCPYSGAGKSHEWATSVALRAIKETIIKEAIHWPNLRVKTLYGPDKEVEPGSNWTYLGSGEILGYELIIMGEIDEVVDTFQTEEEAEAALIAMANGREIEDREVEILCRYRGEDQIFEGLCNGVRYEVADGDGFKSVWVPEATMQREGIRVTPKMDVPVFVWRCVEEPSYTAPPHVTRALDSAYADFWAN